MKKVAREKVSPIFEIPRQQSCWYFKPIKFEQLLVLLTTEKSNFNPKKFKSSHFLSTIHIITLLSFSLFALCLSLPVSLCSLCRFVWCRRAHRQPWVSHGRTSASRTAAEGFEFFKVKIASPFFVVSNTNSCPNFIDLKYQHSY